MNVKNFVTVICVALALYVRGLDTANLPEDTLRDSSGHELMSALAVPAGDESLVFSSWSYPTSIVVKAIPYNVDVKWLDRGCNVFSTNDLSKPVADIFVMRMPNENIARLHVFGNISLGCSLMTATLAEKLSVEYLDPATNTLFVSWRNQSRHRKSYLISKNLVLGVIAPTNAVDFAVALLNAGLPENERIPVE